MPPPEPNVLNLTMFREIFNKISETWTAERFRGFPVLIAVSGGPDSVALLRLMHCLSAAAPAADLQLLVGHVNHALRGTESDADEAFVRDLAKQLGLEFHYARADSGTRQQPPEKSEENLRNLRYAALIDIARRSGARFIATGHTLDDQAETILFRVLRGTGIGGLSGIPCLRVMDETISIVRPLLSVSRGEIMSALQQLEQEYRVDASNHETNYTRNFLRQEILPLCQQRFGDNVPAALIRLGQQAIETESYLETQAAALLGSIQLQSPDRIEIDLTRLRNQPPLLLRQFFKLVWQQQNWPLQAMTFDWWQMLADECRDAIPRPKTANLPGNFRMSREHLHLAISNANTKK